MKEKSMTKCKKIIRIVMVIVICALDIIPASMFIYYLQGKKILISVKDASDNLLGIIGHNLITVSFSILLFVVMLIILRGRFAEELFLDIKKDKKQRIQVIVLTMVLCAMLVALLVIKEER